MRLEATRVLMFMPAEEALPPKVCTGGEMLVAAAGVQPLQRDFRTERFLMAEFTGNDTTKDATFRRLLRIVCGDGACSNPAVMQRVINALKHAEKTSLEGEHADTQHITRLSHSEVRNPPHRLCLISRPALGRRGVVRMSLAWANWRCARGGRRSVRRWRRCCTRTRCWGPSSSNSAASSPAAASLGSTAATGGQRHSA